MLLNLLSNALKFTPEGVRVDVRADVVDGMSEVSVTDTGVGIAPERRARGSGWPSSRYRFTLPLTV